MANLAECAFAVAKDDLDKMGGALRKAEEGEQVEVVYKRIYKHKDTHEKYELYEEYKGNVWTPSKIQLKKSGATITVAEGEDCKTCKVADELFEKGYRLEKSKTLRDVFIDNGWRIDWVKLNGYSYDYTPMINEFEDHITVFFGGRWDFPDSLVVKLNEMGVRWQGAGCEDGMDWEYDEFGNSDFGLRIGSETEYCDGEPYKQHFVEDTSDTLRKSFKQGE